LSQAEFRRIFKITRIAIIFGVFFVLCSTVYSQTQIRRLPPSLERELKLRHGGKVRIIGFTDSVKAEKLIAQSIRDTSGEELDSLNVHDTAIIVIDSSVSLTDKEWLDSMLVELPEYEKTPEGIRFHYPADILVETNRSVVPRDTTLPSHMDPVTKEDLPLYGPMPMPRPFSHVARPNTSIELGAGFPYIPRAEVRSLVFGNQKTAIEAHGKFFTTSLDEPAIKQYWNIGASANFTFPDSLPLGERVPELEVSANTGANKRQIAGIGSTIAITDHFIRLESLLFFMMISRLKFPRHKAG
jgi:hypothetical protein